MQLDWPRLKLADWEPTYQTLHRYTQVVGRASFMESTYVAAAEAGGWNVRELAARTIPRVIGSPASRSEGRRPSTPST